MNTSPDPHHAEALADILDRIANGSPADWFNAVVYDQLGDRTPTEAWRAGEHEAVAHLVDGWYLATDSVVEEARRDPRMMAILEARSAQGHG
jgi:hypothetical protein